MRLLPTLLTLAAALTLAAPSALSQPRALQALQALAQLSPSELIERLQDGHEAVNQALSARRARLESWQTARDARDAAAAMVGSLKAGGATGPGLENALRAALALDEEAARSRSALAESEAQVASRGAELLGLYDGALRLKRREVLELNQNDVRRKRAVAAYRELARRRDGVRAALRPALHHESRSAQVDLDVQSSDDVGTLLEKADLARDLEERFLRRARSIQKRIQELEEHADLARSISDLGRDQSLFDETSRRLIVTGPLGAGPDARPAPGQSNDRADSPLALVGDQEVNQGGNTPPPAPVVVPPPPPASPNAPDADPELQAGVEETDGNFASPGDDDASRGTGVDVGGQIPGPGVGEQVFGGATDADIDALLASGRLSLRQMKALERKLRADANQAAKKSTILRDEVRSRTNR